MASLPPFPTFGRVLSSPAPVTFGPLDTRVCRSGTIPIVSGPLPQPSPKEARLPPDDSPSRLSRLETRYEGHLEDYNDLKHLVSELQRSMRDVENWRVEVNVYFRQIRWLIVLVVAALVTGVINILLNLELHVQ